MWLKRRDYKGRQRPVCSDLTDPLSREKLEDVGKVKNEKAAGQSGIIPVMIKTASRDDNKCNQCGERQCS